MQRASGLEIISSMRLDNKKDIRSVKFACSVLHSELKRNVSSPLEENNKGRKTNSQSLNLFIFSLSIRLPQFGIFNSNHNFQ